MKKKGIVAILFTVVLFCFVSGKGLAKELLIPYSVTIEIPDNQEDKKLSYFDVAVKENEVQEFSMNIKNVSDQPIKIGITAHTARTTATGVVDYTGADYPLSGTLPASFEDIVSEKQVVTIGKGETKRATFKMKMPKKNFKGVLLGGFYLQEVKENKKVKNEKKDSVAIKNVFSTTIGAIVRNSKESVSEQFDIESVKVDNHSGYFSVMTSLENEVSKMIAGYSFESTVMDKKGGKVAEFQKNSFDMAPNSIYQAPEKVKVDDFPAGDYTMKMTVFNKEKSQKWELTKPFTITEKERKAVIKETSEQDDDNWLKWLVIVAMGILVVLIIIMVLIYKKKKSHDV